jgi:uncharacterized cupin superfamily protein
MSRTPVSEAKLVGTDAGMKPEGDGWFVVNIGDAMSMGIDDDQYGFIFEGRLRSFPHFGINVRVLGPGRPASMYHAEAGQEAFLLLQGEGVLIVEDQERVLRQWDFVHCPPHTAHVIVATGEGPCIVLMVGARNAGGELLYPVSAVAGRYGASVGEDTHDPRQAYAGWRRPERRRYPWPPKSAA